MRKALLIVAGIVVVLALVVVAGPRLINWNSFEPEIADAVRDATGKELSIEGDISLSVVPHIALNVAGVKLRDDAAHGGSEIVSLGALSAKVQLWPLIGRRLVIDQIVVTDPHLSLMVDADGRPNWAASPAAAAGGDAAGDGDEGGGGLNDILLGDFTIEGGRVAYADARSGQTLQADDISVTAALPEAGQPVSLAGSLTFNDEVATLSLKGDSPSGVLSGEPIGLEASVESRLVSAHYTGNVRPQPPVGVDGGIDVVIGSVADLTDWLGKPLPLANDPGRMLIRAKFAADEDAVALNELLVEGDGLKARASGEINHGGAVPVVDIDLESDPIDVDQFLVPANAEAADGPVEVAQADADGPPPDLLAAIPDTPFDLSPLHAAQAKVRVRLGGVKAAGFRAGPIDMTVELRDGVATANIAELGLYDGTITGDATLDGSSERLGLTTSLAFEGISVGDLATAATGAAPLTATASGQIQMTGRGESPRALARTLLGEIALGLDQVIVADAPIQPIERLSLDVQLPGLAERPQIVAELSYQGEDAKLTADLPPLDKLSAGEPLDIVTALDSRLVQFSFDGNVEMQPVPAASGALSLAVPSVPELTDWAGVPADGLPPDLGRIALTAQFAADGGAQTLSLDQLVLEVADLVAQAQGQVDASGLVPVVQLTLNTNVINLDRLMPPPGDMAMDPESEMPMDEPPPSGDPLGDLLAGIPDDPIDLGPLHAAEADIQLDIAGLKSGDMQVGRVALVAGLHDGRLNVDLAELGLPTGSAAGSAALDGSGDALGIDVAVNLTGLALNELTQLATGAATMSGGGNVSITAQGRGVSARDIAQSLVGLLQVSLTDVDIADAGIDTISALDVTFSLPGLASPPSLVGNVTYRGEQTILLANLAPLDQIASGNPFDLEASIDSRLVQLTWAGQVSQQPAPALDGLLELNIASPMELADWLGQPLEGLPQDPGPVSLTARFAADAGAATLSLDEFAIQAEGMDVQARGQIDGGGAVPSVVLDIEGGVIDLDRYLPPPGPPSDDDAAAPPADMSSATPGDILAGIPDDPIDLAGLQAANLDLGLRLDGVKAAGFTTGPVGLAVRLQDGVLTTNLDELGLPDGYASGQLRLDGSGSVMALDTRLDFDSLALGKIAEMATGAAPLAALASGAIEATASGASPRALAQSLAGNMRLNLTEVDLPQAPFGPIPAIDAELDLPGLTGRPQFAGGLEFNGEWTEITLDLAPLQQIAGGAPFDLALGISSRLIVLSYAGEVSQPPTPSAAGNLDIEITSIGELAAWLDQPLEGLPQDPGPIALKARFAADGAATTVNIEEFSLQADGINARATASVDAGSQIPTVDADIQIDELDLDRFIPPKTAQSGQPAGGGAPSQQAAGQGWSDEPLDLSFLSTATGNILVHAGRIVFRDLVIHDGTARAVLDGGKISAVIQDLGVNEGTLAADAQLDVTQNGLGANYRASLANVPALPLLKAFADTDRLSGTVFFDTAGATYGRSQKDLVTALNGDGGFKFVDGAINGFNLAATLRDVKTLGMGSDSGVPQRTDFSELSGTFQITNGDLENRDLIMLAPLVRVEGAGHVMMPPKMVNYDVNAKLVASLEGQGGQHALAGLPIPIHVEGPWHDISYDLDWGGVLQAAASDPARLARMPTDMLESAAGLGIDLPIDDLGNIVDLGEGGLLPDLIPNLPGLPGGGAAPRDDAAAPAGGGDLIGGVLEGVIGGGLLNDGGAAPAPAPAPAPAVRPAAAPSDVPAPAPAPVPDDGGLLDNMFDDVIGDDLLRDDVPAPAAVPAEAPAPAPAAEAPAPAPVPDESPSILPDISNPVDAIGDFFSDD